MFKKVLLVVGFAIFSNKVVFTMNYSCIEFSIPYIMIGRSKLLAEKIFMPLSLLHH